MNDNINDDLYLEAKKEIDNDNVDDTLWAKALANSEGSEEKTKALYIKYRSKKLNDNQNNNLDKNNDGFSAGILVGVIITIIILLILFGIWKLLQIFGIF